MKYGIIVMGNVDDLVTVLSELKDAEALDVVTTGVKTKPGAKQVTEEPETASDDTAADPWADDEEAEEKPAAKPKARTKPKPKPAPADDDEEPNIYKETDNFGNVYTMGLPEAPECLCGDPAAKVRAKARSGKMYNAWRCAKGVGDDWKSKCTYSEFV